MLSFAAGLRAVDLSAAHSVFVFSKYHSTCVLTLGGGGRDGKKTKKHLTKKRDSDLNDPSVSKSHTDKTSINHQVNIICIISHHDMSSSSSMSTDSIYHILNSHSSLIFSDHISLVFKRSNSSQSK